MLIKASAVLMSGFFKFFSPLRSPHIKNTKEESHHSVNKPDQKLKQKDMGQTKNKKHDSPTKSKSKNKLVSDGKQLKIVKSGSIEKSPKKTSEYEDDRGSDASYVSTSEEEVSETGSQLDRSLLQYADRIGNKLHYPSESEEESVIIPIMDSQKMCRSPRKKGSDSIADPSSPSKKMRSPNSATKAISVSPKKKLHKVTKPMHELSESAESAESGGEEVHYKVPKLRNPPPADYVSVDFNEFKPLIFAEETKSNDVELILITVPFGFDINELDNKTLQMDGDGKMKKDKDGISWKSHSRKLTKDDKIHEYMPLLPSKNTGQLVPVKPFSRQVTFTAGYEIPVLPDPVIPPKPSFEIPEGLKYRNTPFGCLEEDDEAPKKEKKKSRLKTKSELDETLSPRHGKKRQHESEKHNETLSPRHGKKRQHESEKHNETLSPRHGKKRQHESEKHNETLSPRHGKKRQHESEKHNETLSPRHGKKRQQESEKHPDDKEKKKMSKHERKSKK